MVRLYQAVLRLLVTSLFDSQSKQPHRGLQESYYQPFILPELRIVETDRANKEAERMLI
jgi:hypothetical protein